MAGVEVAIVGGGVMGCAVAYFLASDPDFEGEIRVIERDPSYAHCSTTLSWGGVRQQFSTPENIRMSQFGVAFVREAPERLAVEGEALDLGFRENGYLFLASEAGVPVLRSNYETQRGLEAAVAWLQPDEIAARFPWVAVEDVAAGVFGEANEGWIDPSALLHGFRRKARALGVVFETDRVVGMEVEGDRVRTVVREAGGPLPCATLVNAAGPQAGTVAALAGCALPVAPRKRMSYVFDCREDFGAAPLIIDATGVAFRPEGQHYIAIYSPEGDEDADCAEDDFELEYELFESVIWPTLAQRVPAFEAIKLVSAWAGHYDYNALDQNAVIGRHPQVENMIFCNGFSGHGLQQSPAAGRAVSELILHGAFRTLDLGVFGVERILKGRPVYEANVV